MKCRYCGHEIPEGMLYCEECGKEVRIVPDYNPLDDMLTAQIKVSINGEGSPLEQKYAESVLDATGKNIRRTTGNTAGKNAGRTTGKTAGRATGRTGTGNAPMDRDQRRRQMERKKALKRRKRRQVLLVLAVIFAAVIAACVIGYQNSYAGITGKGFKALKGNDYNSAETYFQKAISKKPAKAEAYTGLSNVYIGQDDLDKAENVFLSAIEKQSKNADIYEACIHFYMDTDQKMEIPILLDDAPGSVAEKLGGYIIDKPTFSLDDKEIFEDVQELTLESKTDTIYYTVDGSEPTTKSTKYSEAIHIEEGETVVTAIAVNKKGVPSLPAKKTYMVELPIEDAPAVSPSTGQYESAVEIEIKVPDGYEAYYTTDKTDPTTASAKYTGPIAMPQGETIFKAILVNGQGRTSGITTRNYMLGTN